MPRPDAFDSTGWRGASRDSVCSHRQGMAADLMANHLPPGMARSDVLALLGPDDDYGVWPESAFAYSMGCWIDCQWLVVEFDQDNNVARVFEGQD